MTTHDLQGREYARLSMLKPFDVIELDGGFTCIQAGTVVIIRNGEGELFFLCEEGEHTLEGQLDDDLDHLIGIYGPITD